MIWSSPERVVARGTVNGVTNTSPWTCVEFGTVESPPSLDAATLEALREEELVTAYRRGRVEGEQAGEARARKELETALTATRRVLDQVREARESWSRALDERMVALSMAVARQIVRRELEGDVESFRSLVEAAIASFPTDQVLRIRLHPDDLDSLKDEETGRIPGDEAAGGREARWIADEEIVRGGCVVEGPDRIVDGRVDAALERIFRAVAHD